MTAEISVDRLVGDRLGRGDRLSQVVSPVAIAVPPTATFREVAVQMVANDIGFVVVAGDGRLLGVVSERDLVRAVAEGLDPDDERASDLMSVEVVSADTSTTIADAADMMVDGGIRHLPVVDKGRVLGVVSMRDFLPLVGHSPPTHRPDGRVVRLGR